MLFIAKSFQKTPNRMPAVSDSSAVNGDNYALTENRIQQQSEQRSPPIGSLLKKR